MMNVKKAINLSHHRIFYLLFKKDDKTPCGKFGIPVGEKSCTEFSITQANALKNENFFLK
jgi:hypothetical protein